MTFAQLASAILDLPEHVRQRRVTITSHNAGIVREIDLVATDDHTITMMPATNHGRIRPMRAPYAIRNDIHTARVLARMRAKKTGKTHYVTARLNDITGRYEFVVFDRPKLRSEIVTPQTEPTTAATTPDSAKPDA